MCSSLPTNLISVLAFFFAFLVVFLAFGFGAATTANFFGFAAVFWIAKVLEAFFVVDFFGDTRSFFAGAILVTFGSDFFNAGNENLGSERFGFALGWGAAAAGAGRTSLGAVRVLKALITNNEPRAANPNWVSPCQSGVLFDP